MRNITLAIANLNIKLITIILVAKKTTLALSEETKKQLANFGTKGESFDSILQRVMDNTSTLCNKTSEDDDVATPEDEE